MQPIIQQQSTAALPAPANLPLIESGVMAAIVVYIITEGLKFFKSKDAREDKLTATLVEDLRIERSVHLNESKALLQKMQSSLDTICTAFDRITAATNDINQAIQIGKRTETEMLHAIRENQQAIALLDQRFKTLSARFEAAD